MTRWLMGESLHAPGSGSFFGGNSQPFAETSTPKNVPDPLSFQRKQRSSRERLLTCALLCSALAATQSLAGAEQSQLENASIRVTWDAAGKFFSLERTGTGACFAQLRFGADAADQRCIPWRHPRLGDGQTIEASLPDGETGRVIVLPELPFVLIQRDFANSTAEDRMLNHVRPFDVTLRLPEPAAELKTLGTAGLTAADGHPGSYAFLAIASPKTRSGVVSGWLSHDRGSGVLFSEITEGTISLRPQIDYGRLRIHPGKTAESEVFAVGWFDDARLGLEQYADTVARFYDIRLRPIPTGYCTWYSSPHGGASDEVHVVELSQAAAEKLQPFGFDFVQIDDYWQAGERRNGPAKNFTTHKADGPFPHGMQPVAEKIRALGLVPGLWFMPFAGDRDDPHFADHQDWFVKNADGTPYWARWGGTSLDMTNPDACEYVRSIVHRIAHEWGYGYFKMDGLWTGTATKLTYVNNGYVEDDIGEAVFQDPDKTNIEAFRDGFKLVREAAGPDVFFLGCCAPQNMRSFGGSFGLVDAMRIGPDNGTQWEALCRGPWHGTNRYFLHGRVWYNDPDPVYVRPSVPLEHARVICSWVTLSGQLNVFSEWLPDLPDDRVDLLRRTMPNHGLRPRPVDLFENELARIWLLTDTRGTTRRDVIGIFNWEERTAAEVDYPLEKIGLPAATRYVGFDYWADRFVPPFGDRLRFTLPGGSCRVLAVRPESEHPQLISTSRHITQGIVDVIDETWDAETLQLRGRSRVVANDPYELRIVVPTGERSFQIIATELGAAEREAGAAIRQEQSGPRIRLHIASPVSREVNWLVRFRRADIQAQVPPPVGDLRADVAYHEIALHWNADAAEAFRITRSDNRVFETNETSLRDRDFAHGVEYRYAVEAVGWDGRTSEPTIIALATPEKLVLPPIPPRPDVSIARLEPKTARTGWGQIHTNRSCEGNPLRLAGSTYEDGMGVHAQSLLIYDAPAKAERLVATVGLDDEKRTDPRSSIVARLYGDAGEMGERPELLAESPLLSDETLRIWHFNVPLSSRVRRVHLQIDEAGDGNFSDHADWVNTGFVLTK